MSRFFRDAASSSSSGTESEESDFDVQSDGADCLVNETTVPPQPVFNPSNSLALASDTVTHHRDLLLHALLEERCMRQTRDQLGNEVSENRVRRHAQQQYQDLAQRLAAYGLVQPGLDHACFSPGRQAVRNGLDVLSSTQSDKHVASTDLTVRGNTNSLQQLEISLDTLQLLRPQIQLPQFIDISQPASISDALLTMDNPASFVRTASTFFSGSRYAREFEEIDTLGRGGYGVVYRCKHRFDGLSYAVKKVPLSTSRLQRIRDQGQAEIDRLLLELTTLAKLDHPNIVRYFGGWVEYATLNRRSILHSNDEATFGASEHTGISNSIVSRSMPWHRVAEVTDDDFISFESTSGGAGSLLRDTSDGSPTLRRYSTCETQPTVTDDDVECISRSVSTSAEHSTLSNFVHDSTPCLALHIQMGLYPLTLADYISRYANGSRLLKHCFHMEPSIRILSALVDGIMYLHNQGIVHRDLKPANIFLTDHQHKQGWCRECCTPTLEGVKVRIGDFGLVAALAHRESNDITAPVGTELYRPHDEIDRCRLEALDWFALGIMAFELLWPFSTHMERHETLSALKVGIYPHAFEQRVSGRASDVNSLLEYLLRSSRNVDPEELQSMLTTMLAKCHGY